VLQALKPRARNPRGIRIDELFVKPPSRIGLPGRSPHQSRVWSGIFSVADMLLRLGKPLSPKTLRTRALSIAAAFVKERQNGEHGLGAIFPAMVNAVLMYDALGIPSDHPDRAIARRAVEKLLLVKKNEAYCQPCLSPVWDTVLTASALIEAGGDADLDAAGKGLTWLRPLQELEIAGDWAVSRPGLRPGGWAFQYGNPHYPDLDDTAVIVMAMERWQLACGGFRFDGAMRRAREWIEGLQSSDGGWAAFDADNTHNALNNIPFADHGALLDPPTPDLTGRCVSMLAALGGTVETSSALRRGVGYLLRNQREDSSWFGRWGINYIYGTWSALSALQAAGTKPDAPPVRKAANWLIAIQNTDGGWGEDGGSYRLDYDGHRPAPSTPSQTAWTLLALMAAGEAGHPAVERGVRFLLDRQQSDGLWSESCFTGTGFPRVFYLRYHGYPKYFPLWALARYRNLRGSGA
jgi:squalene-hopene/tetraprenyl-beta-curcumene cyclase